jgi:hypothetical protein
MATQTTPIQRMIFAPRFVSDADIVFSFRMMNANAAANPPRVKSAKLNENRLEIRSRTMGLMAKDRTRPMPSLTMGWRSLKSNRPNAQPVTYPGKTITSGKRQNASVAPRISCSVKFKVNADKAVSRLLCHPAPHPKLNTEKDVKQNCRVKDQSIQAGFLSD